VVNTVGSAPTSKKNAMGAVFMKVTLHGVNVNSMRVFQNMVLSIVDSVKIFHATSKLDILTPTILKAKEMQSCGLDC
jgi:hypothetical protein